MDASEEVLPFMPQYINTELHAIFNEKEEQEGGSQNTKQSIIDMLVAKGSSLQSKFVKNFKSKVFKRFLLEKGAAASRYEQESTSAQKLSLQDIIMESWTGSRVYKLT